MAPIALVGLMAIGTTMSVIGHLRAASAERQAAEFQAKQAEGAADQADTNAVLTREATAEDERRAKSDNNKVLGSIRNAYGASGVTMDGTPQAYLEEQAAVAKANELSIRYDGFLKAKAYRDQASGYRQQANQLRVGGSNAMAAGTLGAIGAGIGGVTGIAKASGVGFSRSTTLDSGSPKIPSIQRGGY